MATSRTLTAAQAIVEFLAVQFVERDGEEQRFFEGMFGIFGHGNVAGMGEALDGARDRMRYFQARNEQGMVHAAIAFAKRNRRLRAFACTTSIGPGATNLVTGAAAATVNRLPVLLLPGDLFATRRVAPVLQQLERTDSQDISVNDCLRPVSRYWDRINRPEQLISALPAALRVLTSPTETGAVTLALPQDVQAEAFDFPTRLLEPHVHRIARARPDRAALARATALIASSRRPLLVAGGGVIYSDASEALSAFVERFGIPVVETQGGKGSLPWDHPLQLGAIGVTGGSAGNAAARDADVVIAVGTRLGDFTTASWTAFRNPDVHFVSINVTEFDAAKAAATPLVADARVGLDELSEALAERGWEGADAEQRVATDRLRVDWNDEVNRVLRLSSPAHMTQNEVIRVVNELVVPGDVVVQAAGGLPGDLHKLWRTERPGDYHVEYGYSTMGYEIAGGLGVKMASPRSEVVVMVGDGSYLMMSGELLTSLQEGLRLTIVVVDNHGFQCINDLAIVSGSDNAFNSFRYRDQVSGLLSGPTLTIDFAANAASLGAAVLHADTPDELAAALQTSRSADRTTVIVVEVDASVGVPSYGGLWDVPVAEVSELASVRAARRRHDDVVAMERRPG